MYPFASSQLFQVFNCVTIDGTRYLQADLAIECANNKQKSAEIFAGFFIVVVAIGTPLLYVRLLLHYRQDILAGKQNSSNHLTFLYSDYLSRFFYWEAIVCMNLLIFLVAGLN